jgi:hypothetical protein
MAQARVHLAEMSGAPRQWAVLEPSTADAVRSRREKHGSPHNQDAMALSLAEHAALPATIGGPLDGLGEFRLAQLDDGNALAEARHGPRLPPRAPSGAAAAPALTAVALPPRPEITEDARLRRTT